MWFTLILLVFYSCRPWLGFDGRGVCFRAEKEAVTTEAVKSARFRGVHTRAIPQQRGGGVPRLLVEAWEVSFLGDR